MTYGDSSFVLRLLTNEVGSEHAVAVFRRLGRPGLAFSPLHEIEIRNGLRMKAFMELRLRPAASKAEINRELSAWEGRLERFLERGTLVKVEVSWDKVVESALRLSREQTLRLGTRSYDILHVAMAAELHCRDFVTCDLRQAKLARSAGLKVTMVEVSGD
jgi:predicted nucleic acid-binding protein